MQVMHPLSDVDCTCARECVCVHVCVSVCVCSLTCVCRYALRAASNKEVEFRTPDQKVSMVPGRSVLVTSEDWAALKAVCAKAGKGALFARMNATSTDAMVSLDIVAAGRS